MLISNLFDDHKNNHEDHDDHSQRSHPRTLKRRLMPMITMMIMDMITPLMTMIIIKPGRGRPPKNITEKVVTGESTLKQGRALWV